MAYYGFNNRRYQKIDSLNDLYRYDLGYYQDNKLFLKCWDFNDLCKVIEVVKTTKRFDIDTLVLEHSDYLYLFHDEPFVKRKEKLEMFSSILMETGIKNVVLKSIDFYRLEKTGFLPFVTEVDLSDFKFHLQNLMTLCDILAVSPSIHTLTLNPNDDVPLYSNVVEYVGPRDPIKFFGNNGLSLFSRSLTKTHINNFVMNNVQLDKLHPEETANFIRGFAKSKVLNLNLSNCSLGKIKELIKILAELKGTPIRQFNASHNALEQVILSLAGPKEEGEKLKLNAAAANGGAVNNDVAKNNAARRALMLENLLKSLNHLERLDISENNFLDVCRDEAGQVRLLSCARGLSNGSIKELILGSSIPLDYYHVSADEVLDLFSIIFKTNPLQVFECHGSLFKHDGNSLTESQTEKLGAIISESSLYRFMSVCLLSNAPYHFYQSFLKGIGDNKNLRELRIGMELRGESAIPTLTSRNIREYQKRKRREAVLCGTHPAVGKDSPVLSMQLSTLRSNDPWKIIFELADISKETVKPKVKL